MLGFHVCCLGYYLALKTIFMQLFPCQLRAVKILKICVIKFQNVGGRVNVELEALTNCGKILTKIIKDSVW
jgi:hypothetical protein